MKATKFLLCVVSMLVFATACMDDLNNDAGLADKVVKLIPYTVTAQNQDDTKVTLEGEEDLIFQEKDKLVITSEDETVTGELFLKTGASTNSATFEGTLKYSGAGDLPDDNLKLYARLVGENDAIGDDPFVGGVAAKMPEAVKKFSTLTGESKFKDKSFALSQGTAFIKFKLTLEPAPADGSYEAVLFNNESSRILSADVPVSSGKASFVVALPGGTILSRAKLTLCDATFKFGGTAATLEAANTYSVTKTFNSDLNTPLTFEAIVDGTITIYIPEDMTSFGGIYYVKNDEDAFLTKDSGPDPEYKTTTISVKAGDKVRFYGDNATYSYEWERDPDDMISVSILCSEPCYVYGNIMSLVNSTGFASEKTLMGSGTFAGLFSGYQHSVDTRGDDDDDPDIIPNHIVNHDTYKLMLPATQLTPCCYNGMFAGCYDLTTAPELPATILTPACYANMFWDCRSLTNVPAINATFWPEECCIEMFYRCTSLVNPPVLGGSAYSYLGHGCFEGMFAESGLKTAPQLPYMRMERYCYDGMFARCKDLETAPELPAMELAEGCYYKMFYECTSLKRAPELPATYMENMEECYERMFYGCTALEQGPSELPATSLKYSSYCYQEMFEGCTSLVTAPDIAATEMSDASYVFSSMFKDCTSLTTPPARISSVCYSSCYSMFEGCTSLESAPELPAIWLQGSCYCNMFSGCTSLTTAPHLPAPTLVWNCYSEMFSGCTSLSSVSCDATDISAYNCTYNWLENVASTGTFTAADGMTDWEHDSASGIPANWDSNVPVVPVTVATPLTLQALSEECTVSIQNDTYSKFYYMLNGGPLQSTSSSYFSVTIPARGKLQLFASLSEKNTHIDCSAPCYVYGNIMSLIDPNYFATQTSLNKRNGVFSELFSGNTCIQNHPKDDLFLPATTLAEYCYLNMFSGCTGLTRAPELPATTLEEGCYSSMFSNCTGLTRAPELPATTLAGSCYSSMFYGCYNLSYIKCLARSFGKSSTSKWVCELPYSGTFVKATGVTTWEEGSDGIPYGWTVEEEGPAVYAMNYDLEHCKLDYMPEFVDGESSYTASFTTDANYEVETIEIIMGKDDITSECYDGAGNINIDKVTGEVTIRIICVYRIVYYSITQNLTHITTSNSSTEIQKGNTFTALLTPDTDYTIGDVTITMGGVDVSDCFTRSKRLIEIKNVTGDIVVTAVATEGAVNHSISYDLNGAVSSNMSETINDLATYYTGITPISPNNAVEVVVMMGKDDITWQCWSEDKREIIIPYVTDDVAISVNGVRYCWVGRDLKNCSLGNSVDKVLYGTTFESVIIPENPSYTISDVVVTMGGEVINCYDDSTRSIYIGEVTGDLLVSARVSNPNGEWAVTYSLDDDIESSNTSTTVSDKGSYSTTLTAKSYFSVSCWMDGTWYGGASQDDKSGNYVFTLTIPSVTYDFTITAYIK